MSYSRVSLLSSETKQHLRVGYFPRANMMHFIHECGDLNFIIKLDFKDIYCIPIMISGGIDYIDVIEGKPLSKDYN